MPMRSKIIVVNEIHLSMATVRAIDLLQKYASAQTVYRREVKLDGGQSLVFYHQPLTMAEQESLLKRCKTSEGNEFALQLLIAKAQDEKGKPLFNAGDYATIRNLVRRSTAEKIINCLMQEDSEYEVELDMKSGSAAV